MCGDKVVPRVRSGRVSWSLIPQKKKRRETLRVLRTKMKNDGLEGYLKQVIERPLWVFVRDFFTSADVLEMRTTGLVWNKGKTFRFLCRIVDFQHEKEEKDKSESPCQSGPA